ncbi:CD209 antigen-like protein E [Cyprinus carpio]|uniref:CD209 antigen-like protein E n=1 Tax=Cyprinus carpio TaxID=7962 RepID=A0A9Q9XYQ5_CYPCA|nr:CD209 antigen-like protein E [Cyprinus carpio]
MSESIYGNVNPDITWDMDRRTKANHTPQHTGSDSVQIRSSRAAAVCLLLLCVFLLTAVIVLCIHVHTKNTNHREETHKLLTKINNLTEQSDLLLTKYINMTNERNGLLIKNDNLTKQRDQFNQERNKLQKILNETDGWLHSNFSFYFMSSMKKSWDESRRYCTERGADLIIINSREKQDFVTKITDKREFWIGVTDIVEEGRWKWVDGTSVTSGFWASSEHIREPNGGRLENCAVTYLKKNPELIGWIDVNCNGAYQWICEKGFWP